METAKMNWLRRLFRRRNSVLFVFEPVVWRYGPDIPKGFRTSGFAESMALEALRIEDDL